MLLAFFTACTLSRYREKKPPPGYAYVWNDTGSTATVRIQIKGKWYEARIAPGKAYKCLSSTVLVLIDADTSREAAERSLTSQSEYIITRDVITGSTTIIKYAE